MENQDTCQQAEPNEKSIYRKSPSLEIRELRNQLSFLHADIDHLHETRNDCLRSMATVEDHNDALLAEIQQWRTAARKMQIALGADAPLFTSEATLLLVRSRVAHFANLKMVTGTALAIIASEHSWVSESVAKTSPDGNTLRDVARKAAEYARQPAPDPFTNQATPGWAEEAINKDSERIISRMDEGRAIRREDMQKRIFEKFFKDKPPYTEEELRNADKEYREPYTEEELKGCGEILPQTPNPTGRGY